MCAADAATAAVSLFVVAGGAGVVGLVDLFSAKTGEGSGNSPVPTKMNRVRQTLPGSGRHGIGQAVFTLGVPTSSRKSLDPSTRRLVL